MNPEMSGSEAESSDMEGMDHNQLGDAPADSDDDEGFAWRASHGGAFTQSGRNREEEEEEDDDDEEQEQEGEEDDEALPEAAQDDEEEEEDDDDEEETSKAPPVNTMHQWLRKPNGTPESSKGKKAAAAIAVTAPLRPAPLTRPAGKGAKSSAKGAEGRGKQSARSRAFSAQANDDSEDNLTSTTMKDLSKPKMLLPPPDAVQEFEDHRAGLSSSTAAGDAEAEGLEQALSHVSVHESARERVYIIKNEKVNKWFLFNPDGFVYAPDIRTPESSGLFDFTTEQLTVPSKKERISMQEKLIDTHGTQAMNTVCIAKLKTDGSGSGAGPGTHTLAMLLPGKKASPGTEMEDLETKMRQLGMIDADETGRKEIVVLMVLDHELAKRLYKIDKNPLPQVFNPNTNATTKYKVPSRLEDTAKVDTNFVIIGAAEKARRAGKRGSTEESASRTECKRVATAEAEGAEPSASAPTGATGELVFQTVSHVPHELQVLQMPCEPHMQLTLARTGERGNYVVIKTRKE